MERVIEKLAGEYEYVIVDTPPVLPVTDASVLAPKVDGVVLVARIQHTTRDRIRRAKSTLERVNATVLGVVPNQAGKGADRDYRYPYRYAPSRRRGGEPEQPPIASAPGPSAGTRSQQRQGPSEPARRRHAPPPPTAPEPEPVRYQPPQQVHYPQSQEYPAPQQYPPPPQFPSQAAPVSYAPLPPPVNGQERRPAHGYPEQQDW
jgi:receptor protein-tyrosine kinase